MGKIYLLFTHYINKTKKLNGIFDNINQCIDNIKWMCETHDLKINNGVAVGDGFIVGIESIDFNQFIDYELHSNHINLDEYLHSNNSNNSNHMNACLYKHIDGKQEPDICG